MTDDAQHLAWFRRITPHAEEARRQIAEEIAALEIDASFLVGTHAKTALGWVKHDGQIVNMTDADLAREERMEIIDMIVYRAARLELAARMDAQDRVG